MEALAFTGFGFAYAASPDTWVLRGVDCAVDEGAFAVLGGPTGSGKTTLLRCAVPALAPAGRREGRLRVLGQDLAGAGGFGTPDEEPADGAAWEVGYVGQFPAEQIVCDSVWHELAFGCENLGLPQGEMRARVAEIAHYFGMGSWLHEPTDVLSGGQQQLLNLASVLCMRPRLLLLDEPTAQLDPVAASDFAAALARVHRDTRTTVIVATHEPWEWQGFATCSFAVRDGRVVPVPDGGEALSAGDCGAPTADERGQAAGACDQAASELRSAGERAVLAVGTRGQQATDVPPWEDGPQQAAGASPARSPLAAPGASQPPFVQARDVFFRYGRDLPWVLRGMNLQVSQGEVHALIGGNGSGKTTLLRVLAGVEAPQRGRVENRSQAQALLPQDPKLLMACDTVADELAEWQDACGYSPADISAAAERFGLDAVLHTHPFDVSGGQLQQLALAKLLLAGPDLLLLDEPTKGLDAASRRLLARTVRELAADGCTVLLATHDLAFVQAAADAASMLFDGQDAQTAPPAQLFGGNLFYKPHPAALRALECSAGAVRP